MRALPVGLSLWMMLGGCTSHPDRCPRAECSGMCGRAHRKGSTTASTSSVAMLSGKHGRATSVVGWEMRSPGSNLKVKMWIGEELEAYGLNVPSATLPSGDVQPGSMSVCVDCSGSRHLRHDSRMTTAIVVGSSIDLPQTTLVQDGCSRRSPRHLEKDWYSALRSSSSLMEGDMVKQINCELWTLAAMALTALQICL